VLKLKAMAIVLCDRDAALNSNSAGPDKISINRLFSIEAIERNETRWQALNSKSSSASGMANTQQARSEQRSQTVAFDRRRVFAKRSLSRTDLS
jgi:hypothetical protein